jgi:hypothetical protein
VDEHHPRARTIVKADLAKLNLRSALAANLDFSHAAAGLARAAAVAGGAIRITERMQHTGDFVSQGISLPVAYGAISVAVAIRAHLGAHSGTSEHPYCAVDWRFVWRENSTPRSLFSRMVMARSIRSSGTAFLPP